MNHNMDHADEALLNTYLDGALAPDLALWLDAHVAGCSGCAARLAELERVFAALEALSDAPLPAPLAGAVASRLRQERRRGKMPLPARAALAGQALAGLVLLGAAWPYLLAGVSAGRVLIAGLRPLGWIEQQMEAWATTARQLGLAYNALPAVSLSGVQWVVLLGLLGVAWYLVMQAVILRPGTERKNV